MNSSEQIFDTVIGEHPIDPHLLAAGVDALQACALACTVCADADLAEPQPTELAECIRRNRDCLEVCIAVIGIIARWRADSRLLAVGVLQACIVACDLCAHECDRHDHEHCRECSLACRRCESACRALLHEIEHELEGGV